MDAGTGGKLAKAVKVIYFVGRDPLITPLAVRAGNAP
jgi:hypothetical protein